MLDLESHSTSPMKKEKHTPISPSKIISPTPHATVDALVASLSPPRKSGRYFDGELTDGEKVIRVIGFKTAQHDILQSYYEKQLPVTLQGCKVQFNQSNNQLEVAIKDYTKITTSTSTFDVANMMTLGAQEIELKQLPSVSEFNRVICRALVTKQSEPQKVGGGKTKQDVTIKDATGSATLTLWENDVGSLKVGDSYQFNRVVVRTFKNKTYLSLPPSGATIEPIDDLGDVSETDDSDEGVDEVLLGAKIIGVHQLEHLYICLQCKKGKLSSQQGNIATCDLCNTTQELHSTKQTAKLFLEGDDITQHVTIRAYQDMLQAITGDNPITAQNLLTAPKFDASYNDYHVLTGVTRQ
jgi:hypothetical protein